MKSLQLLMEAQKGCGWARQTRGWTDFGRKAATDPEGLLGRPDERCFPRGQQLALRGGQLQVPMAKDSETSAEMRMSIPILSARLSSQSTFVGKAP